MMLLAGNGLEMPSRVSPFSWGCSGCSLSLVTNTFINTKCKGKSTCEHTTSRTSSDKLLHKAQGGVHIGRRSNNELERNRTHSSDIRNINFLHWLLQPKIPKGSEDLNLLACGKAHEPHSPWLHCKHITAPRAWGAIKNSTVPGDNPTDYRTEPERGFSWEVRRAGTASLRTGSADLLGMEWAVAEMMLTELFPFPVSNLVLL